MSSVKDLLRGDVVDGSGTANTITKWSDADTITDSVIYDDGTNVGIGTSSPASKLEVVGTSGDSTAIKMKGTNGSFVRIYADNTNGNVININTGDTLRFLHMGENFSSPVERMRITSGGYLCVNSTSSPNNAPLHSKANAAGSSISTQSTQDVYVPLLMLEADGDLAGFISAGTGSVSYNTSSDYRLKENVVPIEGALDRVDALKPSRFNFIKSPENTIDGFLAHEVAEIVPEAVHGEKDAVDEEGNPVYQGIDQSKLVPLLVGAIQELKAEIETLKAQING